MFCVSGGRGAVLSGAIRLLLDTQHPPSGRSRVEIEGDAHLGVASIVHPYIFTDLNHSAGYSIRMSLVSF